MGSIIEVRCDCGFSDCVDIGVGLAGPEYATPENFRLNVKRERFEKSQRAPTTKTTRVISEEQLLNVIETSDKLKLICPYCQKANMRAYYVGSWD